MYERVRDWAVHQPPVREAFRGAARIAPGVMDQYVAGETYEDAITYTSELNEQDMVGLIDLLGEHHTEPDPVTDAVDTYTAVLEELDGSGIEAELSVKPTQLGLDLSADGYDRCAENMLGLAAASDAQDRRLWIDMEDTVYTDETLGLYREVLDAGHDAGLCVQAYLERSADDIRALPDTAAVRLVKGAYDRDSDFEDRAAIDAHYESLLEQLFDSEKHVAIATHDPDLLAAATDLIDTSGKDADKVEFQFLKGVEPEKREELAAQYRLAEYVPFGDERFEYFWRRVQEHPKYLDDVARAQLGRLTGIGG